MASKCVHRGCGKTFTDPEEQCNYHRPSNIPATHAKYQQTY